jgi:hypothetical protein
MKKKMKFEYVLAMILFAMTAACSGTTATSLPADAGTTLYVRLGGKMGIEKAVDAIVAKELVDPEILPYFGAVGTAGKISAAQIKACLVNQLGVAAGGPTAEVSYPTTVTGGWKCRDMETSHKGLFIKPAAFDKFVTIAAGALKDLGVADADIAIVGDVLNGTKASIVGQ